MAQGEAPNADHIFYQATYDVDRSSDPAYMLLLCFFGYALYLVFQSYFHMIVHKYFPQLTIKEFNVDEHMGYYQNYLIQEDVNWILKEEDNMRMYGMWTKNENLMKSLRNRKRDATKKLKGVHTYDLLKNPKYSSSF